MVSYWIVALEAADFEPAEAKHGPMILLHNAIFEPDKDDVLQFLVSTITRHLGSQQKWYEFVQRGLRCLLMQLSASMDRAVKQLQQQSYEDWLEDVHRGLRDRFQVLAAASMSCSAQRYQCQWLNMMLCHSSLFMRSLSDTLFVSMDRWE